MDKLSNQKFHDCIKLMQDLNLTLDSLKENIITLINDEKITKRFTDIPTKDKSAFTKLYNQSNKTSIKPVKSKKRGATEVV